MYVSYRTASRGYACTMKLAKPVNMVAPNNTAYLRPKDASGSLRTLLVPVNCVAAALLQFNPTQMAHWSVTSRGRPIKQGVAQTG
jgi:hypothetical protein